MNEVANSNTNLYAALCKAQAQLQPAEKDSVAGSGSYKYKYANLAAVMSAAQEALAANGLAFSCRMITEGQINYFYARLCHETGEYLESKIEIGINLQEIKAIQELGKVITYLRRYTFSMMVGIITEEDDDAQSIVQNQKSFSKPQSSPEYITKEQKDTIIHELDDHHDILQMLLDKYGTIDKMPKNQYLPALDRIREIKQIKKG